MSQSLTYVEIDVPEFNSGVVLLDFDGDNGSTTIIDSNSFGSAHTWTANGNAQISTSNPKVGTGALLLDGTGDFVTTPDSTDFDFGTSDFTIEFWFNCLNTAGQTGTVAGQVNSALSSATTSFTCERTATNTMTGSVRDSGGTLRSVISLATYTNAVNTGWHHFAFVRSGNLLILFIDGVSQGSTALTLAVQTSTNNVSIGRPGEFNGNYFNGMVDHFQISLFARWTTAFTPSTTLLQTFRFTIDASYLPTSIAAIPSIKEVRITPAILSLGADLGQRAHVQITFRDHKHVFVVESFDSGTFWGKFRARYGLKLRGRTLRLYQGVVGDTLGTMELRTFVIESTDGPTTDGEYSIIAQDVLKLADGDRSQAPVANNGFLLTDITSTSLTITLSPTGIGDLEYPVSGLFSLGGSEIAFMYRDPYTKLLLRFEGTNGATTTLDDSPTPHTITISGGPTISNAISAAEGSTSLHIAGAGSVSTPDSADWDVGSGSFCVELYVNWDDASVNRTIWAQAPDASNFHALTVSTTGVLTYSVVSASVTIVTMASAAGALTLNTWTHVAVTRTGNVWNIWKGGTSVATTTDTDAVPNFAANFTVVGATVGAGNSFHGYIDLFRFSNGTPIYTAAFTPTITYSNTAGGDVLTAQSTSFRGMLNTVAAAHSAGDRVQLVLSYQAQSAATIIRDLFVTYAGVSSSYITLANWTAEIAAYRNTVYTGYVTEPTSVNKLISEIIEQAGLVVWWDDVSQQIRLQALRAIPTTADTFDASNMLSDSLDVKEQPEKRISQVITYFAKINPTIKEDQINNYRSVETVVDAQSETDYGSPSIKKIFSRWIPVGGRAVANTLNDSLIARFVTPPRRISFSALRYSDEAPALGGGYQVGGWPFQTVTGAAATVPVQVTRLNPRADIFEVETEEMTFAGAAPTSPDVHTIIFDGNTNNVNLRTTHDSIYSAAVSGDTVNVTIAEGIIIGGVTVGVPAFDVGTWASGVTINITVIGKIEGRGGDGGNGGAASAGLSNAGNAGNAGGTALYTRRAITLTAINGEIWGGGGGGGGGSGFTDGVIGYGGGGGGGGAGFATAGSGGGGSFGSTTPGNPGNPGTELAAGTAGASIFAPGGNGGGPGLAGSNGSAGNLAGGSGGAAGSAIDGISFVAFAGGSSPSGDIRGGQVN